jgi:hypothetical protein
MTSKDKKYLLGLLSESHSAVREAVSAVDPNIRVYTGDSSGTEWRVRDIVAHIATWDSVVAKSLLGYGDGTVYLIPNWDKNEDLFNLQAVLEQRELTPQQLYAQWEDSHDEFKTAVQAIPDDQFPGDLLYPWGDERGTIADLVKYMTDHALEHRDEIVGATQEPSKAD